MRWLLRLEDIGYGGHERISIEEKLAAFLR